MILKSLIYKAKVEADQSGSTRAEEDGRKDKLLAILKNYIAQNALAIVDKVEDHAKEPINLTITNEERSEMDRFMEERELKKKQEEHFKKVKHELNLGQFEQTIITGKPKQAELKDG